jgi:hypothetical protein
MKREQPLLNSRRSSISFFLALSVTNLEISANIADRDRENNLTRIARRCAGKGSLLKGKKLEEQRCKDHRNDAHQFQQDVDGRP